MMNKKQLEAIVNNSRRQQLMDKYVAEHGGSFIRCGWNGKWEYKEEPVISNKIEKFERRAAQRSETQAKKRGLFGRKRKNEETE